MFAALNVVFVRLQDLLGRALGSGLEYEQH
jgi:hypothetical protein